jgi:outer membrane protein OmpA-like peptidoglycan-associated protein
MGLDFKKMGKDVAGSAGSDAAISALTKKLKNVQNEKGPIVFKTGSAEIDVAKSEKTLKAIHEIIMNYPGLMVQVEGHTDNVGNAKSNLALSQKRADAVMNHLIKTYKTEARRLKAKGFGDTVPIADNKTEGGRAKNRRVDFSVTKM